MTAAAGLSIASAQTTTTTTTPIEPTGGHPGWHHHRGPWHLLGKLGLSDAQKTQIKSILTAAKPEMQSLHQQMRANMEKLQQTQPTDANYSTIASQVSQTHGSLSAQMLTQRATIRAQIYKVLTPAQQTQLVTLEAQMAARRQSHEAGAEAAPAAQ
jgi:Spy/CpxP family protein refolding chaperone